MSVPGASNPLLLSSAAAGIASIEIERSLRLNRADSAYLSKTFGSAGNRQTWTWAGWVKRCATTETQGLYCNYTSGSAFAAIRIINDYIQFVDQGSGGTNPNITTPNLLRDPSAWYHIIVALDTTQSTPANRCKIYLNGIELTTSGTYPDQNANLRINTASLQQNLGAFTNTGGSAFNGYLAEVHFIDGQALDPTDFGAFDANGIWQPIQYAGTYGTNGFHLPFSDNSSASALGTDDSGNGNDWTVNNISVTPGAGNDSLRDSPTNGVTANDTGAGGEVSGNYATMSPNVGFVDYTLAPLSNGNLQVDWGASNTAWCDWGLTSGKWYYETTMRTGVSSGTGNWVRVGRRFSTSYNAFLWRSNGGTTGLTGSPTFSTYTNGDILGVAIDVDNEQATFYKNGVLQGAGAYSYLTAGGEPIYIGGYANVISSTAFNFGQRAYAYQNVGVDRPSADYKPLCTAFLDTSLIEDGSTVMDVATDTGANILTSTKALCGGNANFLWIKDRDNGSTNHHLIDIVRDPDLDGTPFLASNSQSDEATLGTYVPPSGNSVGWGWYAGSSTVTNNDGTISAQVRANPSAGFSIVSYTGNGIADSTVGHGLNVAPLMFIIKNRGVTSNWPVFYTFVDGSLDILQLWTDGTATNSARAVPTSSVFTIAGNVDVNTLGNNYIAYCFAPVDGYSAFGTYTGNNLPDGPFIYTGFRPRWILIKCTDFAGQDWALLDSVRNTYNVANAKLWPNLTSSEVVNSNNTVDFLSNGFKLRADNDPVNGPHNYIYAAFAENPFKIARAR